MTHQTLRSMLTTWKTSKSRLCLGGKNLVIRRGYHMILILHACTWLHLNISPVTLSIQEHLQVVGPVPGEPVRHELSAALLWMCSGLPLPGSSPLLHGEHPEGDSVCIRSYVTILLFHSKQFSVFGHPQTNSTNVMCEFIYLLGIWDSQWHRWQSSIVPLGQTLWGSWWYQTGRPLLHTGPGLQQCHTTL